MGQADKVELGIGIMRLQCPDGGDGTQEIAQLKGPKNSYLKHTIDFKDRQPPKKYGLIYSFLSIKTLFLR